MEFLRENISYIYTGFGVIILALLIYLGILLKKLYRLRQNEREVWNWLDTTNQDRHEKRLESIRVICLAAIQKQCELSEACIRLKKLMEYYPSINARDSYKIIHDMYEEVKNFDTHEDRQALSKQEKFRQDNRRFRIEDRYEEQMIEAFQVLKEEVRELEGTRYDADSVSH